MRIQIIAVGRVKRDPTGALFKDYAKRLPWPANVKEVETRGRLSPSERRDRESKLLLEALPASGIAVALDGRGETLTSEKFAERLRNWQDRALPQISFLIGGADGLEERVLDHADVVLSLGAMTWPHMLVRVMLVEQLYRASTILAGHPYHRGG